MASLLSGPPLAGPRPYPTPREERVIPSPGSRWERFLIGWCAAFHLVAAAVLFLVPEGRLLTEGTRPALELWPPPVWGVVFLVAGVLCLAVLRVPSDKPCSPVLQTATWLLIAFAGGVWLTAQIVAVVLGGGSPFGLVVWPFLYGPWALAAVRRALRRR